MPEVSVFCPGCGRAVASSARSDDALSAGPLSRDALLGAIAYVAILPAIVLLLVPAVKSVRFIRFHAWQSLLLAAGALALGVVTKLVFIALSVFPLLGFLFAWLVSGLVSLAVFFLWIAIIAKAALGEAYELPLLGQWAAILANRE